MSRTVRHLSGRTCFSSQLGRSGHHRTLLVLDFAKWDRHPRHGRALDLCAMSKSQDSTNHNSHDPPAPSQATLSPVAASLSGATSFACERLVQVVREGCRTSLFSMLRTMNPHLGRLQSLGRMTMCCEFQYDVGRLIRTWTLITATKRGFRAHEEA
jgi:hypothetical protein